MTYTINKKSLTAIMANPDPVYANVGKRCVEDMVDYYKAVYMLDHQIIVWKSTLDNQEYRERLEDGDRRRRILHDAAISSLSVANRLAQGLGLQPITNYDPQEEYRGYVGDAIFEYVENTVNIARTKS